MLGGGGIVPDVEVPNRVLGPADRALQRALGAKVPRFRDAVVDYALSLSASHAVKDPGFVVTPAMLGELYARMQARGIVVSRAAYDSSSAVVTRALASQLSRYAFGQRAEFERTLREDAAVARATGLLRGVHSQKELLARATGASR